MKHPTIYLVFSIIAMLVITIAIPGCVKINTSGKPVSLVSDATLAAAVDNESKPVNASNTFTVATETIFISFKLSNAPANTRVMARLTYLGGEASSMANSTMFEQSLSGQGTKYLAFTVKPPPGGFPQGNYQVILSANGQQQASIPFTVQNLSAQKLTASNEAGATTGQLTVTGGQALAGAPDLIVTDLWLDVCTIYYKVKNIGAIDSPPTYTYLYVDNMFPTLGGTSFVDILKPGEERGMQFSSYQWPWCGTGGAPGSSGGGGPTGQVMYVQGQGNHYNTNPGVTVGAPNHNTPVTGVTGGFMDFSLMNHMIKACADGDNKASEANKNNNCTSKIYGVLFKYDLLPQQHMATWLSNLGPLDYFTTESSTQGAHFKLSEGSLETMPPKSPNGWVQGYFGYFYTQGAKFGPDTGPTATPILPILIPPKLKFIGNVGLATNATGTDGVTFKLGLKGLDDVTNYVQSKTMTQPGVFEDFVVDLKDYEGQVAYFVLRTEAGASADNDFAIWKEARLEQFQ